MFNTEAWSGFKLRLVQKVAGLCEIQIGDLLELRAAGVWGLLRLWTCGDEGRCEVCNLQESGCSLTVDC